MSKNVETPPNNGAVFTILQIIKAVMSSAAEAEIEALYINCHEAVPARHILELMGHKQQPTPMQTDNTTALGVINKNVMKKSKTMDMKYHWLRCRISQMQFGITGQQGQQTWATTLQSITPQYTIKQQEASTLQIFQH
jgi:hypothetical protein